MYFFVPYNISDIQKGIQAGHAALEYAYIFKDDPDYIDFIKNDKTWIILNGGTTNSDLTIDYQYNVDNEDDYNFKYMGDLNNIADELYNNDIKFASFKEPDLNNALTAICFLADERVFNFKDFPTYTDFLKDNGIINAFDATKTSIDPSIHEIKYKEWLDLVGGMKNVILKGLIYRKKLA